MTDNIDFSAQPAAPADRRGGDHGMDALYLRYVQNMKWARLRLSKLTRSDSPEYQEQVVRSTEPVTSREFAAKMNALPPKELAEARQRILADRENIFDRDSTSLAQRLKITGVQAVLRAG